MALTILRACETCLDAACVDACPVDCIHGPLPVEQVRGRPRPGLQLYIDPAECICCSACEPVCPASAIVDGDEPAYAADLARNEAYFTRRGS